MAEHGSSAVPGGRLYAAHRDPNAPELDQAIETLTGRLQTLMAEVAALWDQLQGCVTSRQDPSATRDESPAAHVRVAEGYGWPPLRHRRFQVAAGVGTADTARSRGIAAVLRDRERFAGRRWWSRPYPRWWPVPALGIAAMSAAIVFYVSGDDGTSSTEPGHSLSEPIPVPSAMLRGGPIGSPAIASAPAFVAPAVDEISAVPALVEAIATAPRRDADEALPAPPSVTTWRVQEGDKLSLIALRFGTSVEALVALNSLPDPDVIRLGQELLIPAATEDSP